MKNWKHVIYLVCAIQIGAGISMMGIMSFLPLFLSELGITDPGEAAFWAGIIIGVTPFMIAFSAPFWSIQADRRGPKTVMSIVLIAVVLSSFFSGITTAPWQLLLLRTLQGLVGGFVPIGLSIVVSSSRRRRNSLVPFLILVCNNAASFIYSLVSHLFPNCSYAFNSDIPA